MSNVKPGLKVVVIGDNNQIRKGTVREVYDCVAMAIVEFNDGNIEKVPYKLIGIDPFPTYDNQAPVEEPTEPIKEEQEKTDLKVPDDNAEITITFGEFRDLSCNLAMKMGKDFIDGLKFVAYGSSLASHLFESHKND